VNSRCGRSSSRSASRAATRRGWTSERKLSFRLATGKLLLIYRRLVITSTARKQDRPTIHREQHHGRAPGTRGTEVTRADGPPRATAVGIGNPFPSFLDVCVSEDPFSNISHAKTWKYCRGSTRGVEMTGCLQPALHHFAARVPRGTALCG
jgi:hypothetical protein